MAYALSTLGQGSTAYIQVPTWSAASATEETGGFHLKIKFSIHSLAAINHIIGNAGSTAGSLRVTTAGALLYRNNTSDLISTASGVITTGTIYEVELTRRYTPSAAIELKLNGSVVNTTSNVTLGWLTGVNQLGRFSTSAHSAITVYEFATYNGFDGRTTYSASWNDTTSTGAGSSWASVGGARDLVIINATGAANSWWYLYGTSEEHSGSFTSSFSFASATTSIKNSLISISAQANIAATVSSTKSASRSIAASMVLPTILSSNKTAVRSLPLGIGISNVLNNTRKTSYSPLASTMTLSSSTAKSKTALSSAQSTFSLSTAVSSRKEVITGVSASFGLSSLNTFRKSGLGAALGSVGLNSIFTYSIDDGGLVSIYTYMTLGTTFSGSKSGRNSITSQVALTDILAGNKTTLSTLILGMSTSSAFPTIYKEVNSSIFTGLKLASVHNGTSSDVSVPGLVFTFYQDVTSKAAYVTNLKGGAIYGTNISS